MPQTLCRIVLLYLTPFPIWSSFFLDYFLKASWSVSCRFFFLSVHLIDGSLEAFPNLVFYLLLCCCCCCKNCDLQFDVKVSTDINLTPVQSEKRAHHPPNAHRLLKQAMPRAVGLYLLPSNPVLIVSVLPIVRDKACMLPHTYEKVDKGQRITLKNNKEYIIVSQKYPVLSANQTTSIYF